MPVNRLGDQTLLKNSMILLADRLDMTIAVNRGVKQQHNNNINKCSGPTLFALKL